MCYMVGTLYIDIYMLSIYSHIGECFARIIAPYFSRNFIHIINIKCNDINKLLFPIKFSS